MPIAAVLAALLLGVATRVDLLGREFTISYIDVLALSFAAWGAAVAGRRGRFHVDRVAWAYVAFLGVVVLQSFVLPDRWDILGGGSRFGVPLLLLVGLTQVVPAAGTDPGGDGRAPSWLMTARERSGLDGETWDWPLWFGAFGVVLALWVLGLVGLAFLDDAPDRFYTVKNSIVMPLGASNYLAGFLLAPLGVAVAYTRRSRAWIPVAVLCAAGLVGTLSRGAGVATVGVLAVIGVNAASARRTGPATTASVAVVPLLLMAQNGVELGSTVVKRFELWRLSWHAFLDSPAYGVGLNRFGVVTNEVTGLHDNAHNLFFHSLAEMGLLGTVPYLAIWGAVGWRVWRLPRGVERTALLLAAAGLVAHAQVEAIAFSRAYEVLGAVLLVLAAAASRGAAEARR